MTIAIWSKINKLGALVVGYSMLKILGCVNAIVLFRLLSEFNFASNNNKISNGYFFIDIEQMCKHLGLENKTLLMSLNALQDLGLIIIFDSDVKDLLLVQVEEDNILELESIQQRTNKYSQWYQGLLSIQEPKNRLTAFNQSTKIIKKIVERNNIDLPLVTYAVCNQCIKEVEHSTGKNFSEFDNIQADLQRLIHSSYFDGEELVDFVLQTCIKIREG